MGRISLTSLASTATALALLGCGNEGHPPPTFSPIPASQAVVGEELTILLHASDPDGDALHFDFDAPQLTDLKTRTNPATITSFANGLGVFRWSPIAADVATTAYAIDFSVSDSASSQHQTGAVTVDDSGGDHIVFVQPLGESATVSVSRDRCLSVPVLVNDNDSAQVTIAAEPPLIAGANLQINGAFGATFSWCPTAQQAAAQDHYLLTLSASSDVASERVVKTFFILIQP